MTGTMVYINGNFFATYGTYGIAFLVAAEIIRINTAVKEVCLVDENTGEVLLTL